MTRYMTIKRHGTPELEERANMLVSVIIPSFKLENFQDVAGAISSLLRQSYAHIEIVLVIHTDKRLYHKLAEVYGSQSRVRLIFREESLGPCAARNIGIREARGDILAFMDDDAIADSDWIAKLVETYQKFNAMAVGGKILPLWLDQPPDYFPEELYWLVGVTPAALAKDEICEVRNAFGPNMSFRREVFQRIGLFNENVGFFRGDTWYIQGEEAEFSLRMTAELGARVLYNPGALVYHRVPRSKARISLMLKRSFYQGYSKALLQRSSAASDTMATEKSYLRNLVKTYIPQRIREVVTGPNRLSRFKQLAVLLWCILAVGSGFAWGQFRVRRGIHEGQPPGTMAAESPGQRGCRGIS